MVLKKKKKELDYKKWASTELNGKNIVGLVWIPPAVFEEL